jgi:hypothetical protein
VLTVASRWRLGLDVRTVGDMGDLPDTLPVFLLPHIPFTLETLHDHPALFHRRSPRSGCWKA